jgi:hypothetical protein
MFNPAIGDIAAQHDQETWQQKGKNRTIVSGRKNLGADSGFPGLRLVVRLSGRDRSVWLAMRETPRLGGGPATLADALPEQVQGVLPPWRSGGMGSFSRDMTQGRRGRLRFALGWTNPTGELVHGVFANRCNTSFAATAGDRLSWRTGAICAAVGAARALVPAQGF